jgi:carbon monoxide dehydrogenase subunit G
VDGVNRFSTSITSTAEIPFAQERIWSLVSDPDQVADMTPFLRGIRVLDEETWVWELHGIPYPGGEFTAHFTEAMELREPERIDFTHDPDGRELAGADGWYSLAALGEERTRLAIGLTVHAMLPAPKFASRIIEPAMHAVVQQMGNRFAANLERELTRG